MLSLESDSFGTVWRGLDYFREMGLILLNMQILLTEQTFIHLIKPFIHFILHF